MRCRERDPIAEADRAACTAPEDPPTWVPRPARALKMRKILRLKPAALPRPKVHLSAFAWANPRPGFLRGTPNVAPRTGCVRNNRSVTDTWQQPVRPSREGKLRHCASR